MKALVICNKIKIAINEKKVTEGVVHSVFHNACNIVTPDGKLITLLTEEKSMFPYSVRIKGCNNFYTIGLEQGMLLKFHKENITLLNLALSIEIKDAEVWNCQTIFTYEKAEIKDVYNRKDYIGKYIYKQGKLEGVGALIFNLSNEYSLFNSLDDKKVPLSKHQQFIFKRFCKFIETVINYDLLNISKATTDIIGFGPGLTPSTDDFISGLMMALVYVTDYLNKDVNDVFKINSYIIRDISSKTTTISESMLKFAAKGETSETVRHLLIEILNKDGLKLNSYLEELLNFGDTSGTDILSGIFIGSLIVLKKIEKGG